MKLKSILKAVIFGAIFLIILFIVYTVSVSHDDYRDYQWVAGFYEEEPDSLDAVYIGGSNVYAFWEAPIAWNDYGITVYPFSSNSQPLVAARYLIEEARKTQPNALYIVNISGISYTVTDKQIHYLTDYMPYSINKFNLINRLCEIGEIPVNERMQFYFPLTMYHSRWNELKEEDFHHTNNGLKGGSVYDTFLNNTKNVSNDFKYTEKRARLYDFLQESLDDLLNYCDEENVNVLFVNSPQAGRDQSYLAKINTINDMVASRGYPYINLANSIDDIGLDPAVDYYNDNHTNIHGSLKATKYLSEYLIQNYGFNDKRSDSAYGDWNDAYEKYVDIISPHVLDLELSYAKRDYDLSAPELTGLEVNGKTLTIKWKKVDDADGYRIYRKHLLDEEELLKEEEKTESNWEMIAEVDADKASYKDSDCTSQVTYTYTVIPYRIQNGEKIWGEYNSKGLSAEAKFNAPKLLSVEQVDGGIELTWEKVNFAEGYKIYRRYAGENSWQFVQQLDNADLFDEFEEGQGEDNNSLSYIDYLATENVPYYYAVSVYVFDEENTEDPEAIIEGSHNKTGILFLPELILPEVNVTVGDSGITLSWSSLDGMSGYNIYRKTADTKWELLADAIQPESTEFTDITIRDTGEYTYKVESFLKKGTVKYVYDLPNEFDYVKVEKTGLQLDSPQIKFVNVDRTGIRIVWDLQDEATGYRVYRKQRGDNTWETVKKSISGNTYLDSPDESGTYMYYIQALYEQDGIVYLGVFDGENVFTIEWVEGIE